jgi:hypothetical protein
MKRRWTEQDRDTVRSDYKGTDASAREIAQRLGRTMVAVKCQVKLLGIGRRTDRHRWDPQQDEQLRRLLPRYAALTVARRLGRSVNSVVVHSKRLGIHRRIHDGWYTENDVCEILGVNHHWIRRRIDSGALRATYHNGRRPTNHGSAMWQITARALRAYIRRYPDELTGRNVDIIQIVELLAGLLPMKR